MAQRIQTSTTCLIIGCGPVGALAGNLLGLYGVPALIVEREPDVLDIPRAVHFDDETMRIFQSVGLDERARSISRPVEGMDLVDGRGRTLLALEAVANPSPLGHAQAHLFHQPELERILREGLNRFPCVELRSRCDVLGLTETTAGVQATARDLDSGETFTIDAEFVLGCDGARSQTRGFIGAAMDDLGLHQPWLVIDILLKGKVDLPKRAIQVCNPRRPATLIPVPPPRFRWEFMLMPSDDPETIRERESVERLLSPWVRPGEYELERSAVYTFHALVARPWRKGRVFILGDAAHQTPPFLGQGMCAGIRDAFNLCWKLVVARGREDAEALLDSYETERRPHVEQVIAHAVRLGRIIQSPNRLVAAGRNLLLKATRLLPIEHTAPDAVATIPLGKGVADTSRHNLNRKRLPLPQPVVADSSGRRLLLDEALGAGFSLVFDGPAPPEGSLGAGSVRPPLGLRILGVTRDADLEGDAGRAEVFADPSGLLREWFRERRANVALLRPDRVPLGVYRWEPGGSASPPWTKALSDLTGGLDSSDVKAPASGAAASMTPGTKGAAS